MSEITIKISRFYFRDLVLGHLQFFQIGQTCQGRMGYLSQLIFTQVEPLHVTESTYETRVAFFRFTNNVAIYMWLSHLWSQQSRSLWNALTNPKLAPWTRKPNRLQKVLASDKFGVNIVLFYKPNDCSVNFKYFPCHNHVSIPTIWQMHKLMYRLSQSRKSDELNSQAMENAIFVVCLKIEVDANKWRIN